jgi:L-asparaginase
MELNELGMVNELVVLSTGGTIASIQDGNAAIPQKDGSELLGSIPEELDSGRVTTVENVAQIPSFDMNLDTIADVGDAAATAAAEGADGIVVTHGTDTMEETAYVLDLTRDLDIPVVITGAQRRPDERSPDGSANLATAIRAASDDRMREAGGVYVAFDMELHAGRDVTKAHTSALGTFSSPGKGPVASLDRERIRIHRSLGSYSRTLPATRTDADVATVRSGVGVGARQVEAVLDRGVDGLVVEGTGLGNTTAAIGDAVAEAIGAGVPVVVGSRCHAGSTAPVYGTAGGGQTLVDHGAVQAGDLPAHKARLKLALALADAEVPAEALKHFRANSSGQILVPGTRDR